MAAGAVISERVSHRLGAYRVVGAAMLLMAAGIASVSLLGADADFASLMPSFALIGIGGGLTVPLTSSVLEAMPRAEAGVASGIFNASREVSGLLGITVIGAVLTARQSALLAATKQMQETQMSFNMQNLKVQGPTPPKPPAKPVVAKPANGR